jgi:PAS domain-containing protein
MEKKRYTAPRIIEYLPDEVPKWIKVKFNQDSVAPAYTTLIDGERRYVQVSNAFSELLGYKSEELIGRRFDEITAPRTSDIPTIFGLFKKLGYMQGLWLFAHRTGKRILIRYESWLRPDSLIESNIEVVAHLH